MPVDTNVVLFTDRVAAKVGKFAQALTTELGAAYAREVKRLMVNSPATGRAYRRGRVVHRASAPGEPPAPDRGDLVRSVMFNPNGVRRTSLGWVAEVGSRLRYARFLEFGAARGVRGAKGRIESVRWVLFPRPAWKPALDNLRRAVPGIVARFRR